MKEVYANLYDITNSNMGDEQHKLGFLKETFVAWVEINPYEIDFLSVIKLENSAFLEVSYMLYFDRLPDAGAIENWSKKYELDTETFQKQVTNSLLKSLEFKMKNVKVINNIYEEGNVMTIALRESESLNKVINKLYIFYSVTVRPLKIKINKIVHHN